MRLIPPTISLERPNDGERLVFKRLAADRARADWTVLHSLDIVDPAARLAAEIDFLVVVPGKGVLVVEVEGGALAAPRGRPLVLRRRSLAGRARPVQAGGRLYAQLAQPPGQG